MLNDEVKFISIRWLWVIAFAISSFTSSLIYFYLKQAIEPFFSEAKRRGRKELRSMHCVTPAINQRTSIEWMKREALTPLRVKLHSMKWDMAGRERQLFSECMKCVKKINWSERCRGRRYCFFHYIQSAISCRCSSSHSFPINFIAALAQFN